ncbi:MAG: bifunctional phosphoribosylaminoimidazolecarboxamide formyltransferase/IMP cyclohydrolase [Phycisphaerae bacterium]
MLRRALVSVSNKDHVTEFVQTLHREFGWEIVSTGGTAARIASSGIPVRQVEDLTGFPEMMDGRVKTLHPRVHGAILADRSNPSHTAAIEEHGIETIDMVVVNLYPFEDGTADGQCTFADAIELIDIGGPCLIRAAAKNHRHVAVVCDPSQYDTVIQAMREHKGTIPDHLRRKLAATAFERTAGYDRVIAQYLQNPTDTEAGENAGQSHRSDGWPSITRQSELRYGENPHQAASVWSRTGAPSGLIAGMNAPVHAASTDHVSCSFNNLVDADAAWGLCLDLDQAFAGPNCVFVKHNNACGVGLGQDPSDAYEKAYLGDFNAAMGGVLACNFAVDASFAEFVMHTYDKIGKNAGAGGFFVEVWLAREFTTDALDVIRNSKPWGKRVRLLPMTADQRPPSVWRTINGGFLEQSPDTPILNDADWHTPTTRKPTDDEMRDLSLAWIISKHTKSNAISICQGQTLLGNGAGQMSRVMSCRLACWLARDNGHEGHLAGAVAASDGFFPFADGPAILADAGITAMIQPGGSKRDDETVQLCDDRNIALVLTGMRHFRH